MKKRILKVITCLTIIICVVIGVVVSMLYRNESNNEKYLIASSGGVNISEQLYVSGKQIKADIVTSNVIQVQGKSISELKSMFPAGRYWNHEGSPSNTDPYSVTSSPCHSTYYDTSCCNVFEGGAQCHGYALFLSYLYHGANVSTYKYGISHNISDLQVGDVVRYRIPGSSYDHSIFVTGINGNTVYYSDCNNDLRCGIRWNLQISKSELANLISGRLNSTYDFPGQYSETGFILSYSKRTINYDISECAIEVSNVNRYKGETEPKVTVKHEGKTLTCDTDYDYYFASKGNDGGYIMICGQGKFEGEVLKEYKIIREDLAKCKTVNFKSQYEYNGKVIEPKVKIVDQYGRELKTNEYDVSYPVYPIEPGKYKIRITPSDTCDIYDGELEISYTITKKDIGKCSIKYEDKVEFVGIPLCPKIEIYDGEKWLCEGVHFEVSYRNNSRKGNGEIIVKGKGTFYNGEILKKFSIIVEEHEIKAH
ncbi:MAG: hypothetical protein IJC76_08855 [Lachnospiraceae bacterium]|nr:hypothetical protein [Lachnospiraceae bacterium]